MDITLKSMFLSMVAQAEFWQLALFILGPTGASLWAAFKVWVKKQESKYNTAYEMLEVGVEETYVEMVRELKTKNGKLSKQDILDVRKAAIDKAVELGKIKGLDIIAILGKEYLPVLIARIVASNKKEKNSQ